MRKSFLKFLRVRVCAAVQDKQNKIIHGRPNSGISGKKEEEESTKEA
jgi:hypothetical protein